MKASGNDMLVKVAVVLFVFPVCVVVFSLLFTLPIGLLLRLFVQPRDWMTWTLNVAGAVAGIIGAVWVCGLAWPKSHAHEPRPRQLNGML